MLVEWCLLRMKGDQVTTLTRAHISKLCARLRLRRKSLQQKED